MLGVIVFQLHFYLVELGELDMMEVGRNGGPYRHIDFGVLSVPSLLLFQLPLCLLSLLLS